MKTAHMTLLHMQMHPRLISLQHFRSAPRPIAHTRSSNVAHPRLLVVAMAQKQQPLTSAERKAKKAEAQRLGKALVSVNLGQKGMTTAFLQDMANAISRNELVKVRVPGGDIDMEESELIDIITEKLDCVLVHKIGFTFTFYRDKALPPAGKVKPLPLPPGDDDVEEDIFEDSDDEFSSEEEDEEVEYVAAGKKGEKLKKKRPQAPRPDAPPEFTIL